MNPGDLLGGVGVHRRDMSFGDRAHNQGGMQNVGDRHLRRIARPARYFQRTIDAVQRFSDTLCLRHLNSFFVSCQTVIFVAVVRARTTVRLASSILKSLSP